MPIFLYGKKSIRERLKKNPASIQYVYIQRTVHVFGIEQLVKKHNIPCERVSEKELNKKIRAKNTQGIIAAVTPFTYTLFEELIDMRRAQRYVLIFLDRINDPHNMGVIMRTAACFGNYALVIPEKEACEINETVVHVAVGGENYVPVARIKQLHDGLHRAKKNGYWIMGAIVDQKTNNIESISMKFPLALVMGSEKEGISQNLNDLIDTRVHIPTHGVQLSLNVNTAFAIFCYEIEKQKALFQ